MEKERETFLDLPEEVQKRLYIEELVSRKCEESWEDLSKKLLDALHEVPPQRGKIWAESMHLYRKANRIKSTFECGIGEGTLQKVLATEYECAINHMLRGIDLIVEEKGDPEKRMPAYLYGKQRLNLTLLAYQNAYSGPSRAVEILMAGLKITSSFQ